VLKILIEFAHPAEEERASLLEAINHNGMLKRQMPMRLHALKLSIHSYENIQPMLFTEQEAKQFQDLKNIFPKLPAGLLCRYLFKDRGDIINAKHEIKKKILPKAA